MSQDAKIKNESLAERLVRAQQSAQAVTKDARNEFHKYDYVSSESIIREAREALHSAGLSVVCVSSNVDRSSEAALLIAIYRVQSVSGEGMDMHYETPIVPDKGRPMDKAVGAARTYSLSYFLRDLLLLPRVDKRDEVDQRDDTGDTRSHAPGLNVSQSLDKPDALKSALDGKRKEYEEKIAKSSTEGELGKVFAAWQSEKVNYPQLADTIDTAARLRRKALRQAPGEASQ